MSALINSQLYPGKKFRIVGIVANGWQSPLPFLAPAIAINPISGGGVLPTEPTLTDLSNVPYLTSQEAYNKIINTQWATAAGAGGNNPAIALQEYLGMTEPIKWTAIVSTMNTNNLDHLTQALLNDGTSPGNCDLVYKAQHAIDNIDKDSGTTYPIYDICGTYIAEQVYNEAPTTPADSYLFCGPNIAPPDGTRLANSMAASTIFGRSVSVGNTQVWTGIGGGLQVVSGPTNAWNAPGHLAPYWPGGGASQNGYTGLGYGMNDYLTAANGPPPLPVPNPPPPPPCITPANSPPPPNSPAWWPNYYPQTGTAIPYITRGTWFLTTDQTWAASKDAGTPQTVGPTLGGIHGFLYAISETLQVPPTPDPLPPIDPAKIPLVNPRIGVCHPWCVINLPGGIDGNVVQPQPIQMSTKMRNVQRLQAARGWRRVTLEQYKNIKAGKATFLGRCYKKKK